jgi:hypothetical protein
MGAMNVLFPQLCPSSDNVHGDFADVADCCNHTLLFVGSLWWGYRPSTTRCDYIILGPQVSTLSSLYWQSGQRISEIRRHQRGYDGSQSLCKHSQRYFASLTRHSFIDLLVHFITRSLEFSRARLQNDSDEELLRWSIPLTVIGK